MTEATEIRNSRHLEILQNRSSRNFRWIAFISLAHLPLGVMIYYAGPFAILHPIAVLGIGLYWAVNVRFRLERVALAIAYLVGAEVLWRMAGVPVFWEFGKYGSAMIAIAALLKRSQSNIPKLALAYFAMLIPACVLTLAESDFASARSALSFNMSGPLLLLVCCCFFSCVKISVSQLRQLLIVIIVPLFSVAFASLFFTITTEDIQFNTESNSATSGGFGPNQVSGLLGLGVFAALLCFLIFQNSMRFRIFFLATSVLFAAQSIMTFSRGGIYNALGAILIVIIIELQKPSIIARRLAPIALVVILFFTIVFPILNSFTGGNLQDRFEDTGTTNRSDIAEADFQVFAENPVLGVGVGASSTYRKRLLDYSAASHTEFSRLISEHGIFGVFALLCLIAIAILGVMRQHSILGKAVVAGAVAWSSLFMLNSGMRLAAPSFMFGFAFITIVSQGQKPEKTHFRTLPISSERTRKHLGS